jgi:hypothetical protein
MPINTARFASIFVLTLTLNAAAQSGTEDRNALTEAATLTSQACLKLTERAGIKIWFRRGRSSQWKSRRGKI